MIDIHSHIIFDVDDGPQAEEDSLALLKDSYDQGVRTIVATSHRRKGMFESPEKKIASHFKRVKKLARQVADDLEILYGAEIYYSQDVLDRLDARDVPTLAETSFALIEFSGNTSYKEIYGAVTSILRLGITPVLAHIERYQALDKDIERVKDLIELGCLTQVNAAHVLKPKLFGDPAKAMKKKVQQYLAQNLVHFVASDMHNMTDRPSYMKLAYQAVAKQYGTQQADALFKENQQLLLDNELL